MYKVPDIEPAQKVSIKCIGGETSPDNLGVISTNIAEANVNQIIGINHIGIRVKNLDSARKFYEQLGFVFLIGPIGPEPVAIMEHPSGVNINFILNADPGITENILMDVKQKYPGYTHIALSVKDIKAVQEEIERLKIPVTEGPIRLPNGGIMFFIRDQDKNVIEFHQNAS